MDPPPVVNQSRNKTSQVQIPKYQALNFIRRNVSKIKMIQRESSLGKHKREMVQLDEEIQASEQTQFANDSSVALYL